MTAHSSHARHANCGASLARIDRETREAAVERVFREAGCGLTDRSVASALGFGEDINSVRPSITSLLDPGVLLETMTVICPTTRHRVRLCVWVEPSARVPRRRMTLIARARSRARKALAALDGGDIAEVRRRLDSILEL